MRVLVLGSAAGGGLPQWNCGCDNCNAARAGKLLPRTQDSLALSADGEHWVLLNTSPDVRQQLAASTALHPRRLRDSPLTAVVLTNADVDHSLGLFVLREGSALSIHGTGVMLDALRRHDALCRTLERSPEQTRWTALDPERPQPLLGARGEPTGLSLEAVPVPGKLPPHWVGLVAPDPAHNVGLLVRDERGDSSVGYAPCVAHDAPGVRRILREARLAFFDGTFWSDDELVALGAGQRRAADMAHWPLSGALGSLEFLRREARGRSVLTHVNNTNPILRDGPERAAVLDAGLLVAHDGMDLSS